MPQDHLLSHHLHQGNRKPWFRRETNNPPALYHQAGPDSLQQVLLQRHGRRGHHHIPKSFKQYQGKRTTTLPAGESHRMGGRGNTMAFLSQKTLQLFEQEHVHTHPRQISGSACCCQLLLTHMVSHPLGQGALGRSSFPTPGQTHRVPDCRGTQSRACAGIHVWAAQLPNSSSCVSYSTWNHSGLSHPPLLPPVALQQSVAASKEALESLWESRSSAAPQNLEIRVQLH